MKNQDRRNQLNWNAEDITIKSPSIRNYLAHRSRHRLDTIEYCGLKNIALLCQLKLETQNADKILFHDSNLGKGITKAWNRFKRGQRLLNK